MSIVEASSDTLNTMVLGASYPNYEDNLPPARRRIHQRFAIYMLYEGYRADRAPLLGNS